MSYDIVQKLREMTDKELFDTCIVNLVFKHKGNYTFETKKDIDLHKNTRFKKTLFLFQNIIHNADEGRILTSEYAETIPIYVELATRINKIRKYSNPSPSFNKLPHQNIYTCDSYKFVNKRIEFKASPYMKMRLGLVVSYSAVLKRSYIGMDYRYISSYVSQIEKIDGEILKEAREILKPIRAMNRNLNDNYYDIY